MRGQYLKATHVDFNRFNLALRKDRPLVFAPEKSNVNCVIVLFDDFCRPVRVALLLCPDELVRGFAGETEPTAVNLFVTVAVAVSAVVQLRYVVAAIFHHVLCRQVFLTFTLKRYISRVSTVQAI